MKRYSTSVAIVGCVLAFAVATGTARAAGYDPVSQSGFINRGEVIAAGGKAALIPNPIVAYTLTMRSRLTCTWPDSTQLSTTLVSTLNRDYLADTRFAGNGTITGYFLSPSNEFNSEIDPPFFDDTAICWSLRGVPDDGTPVQTDVEQLSSSAELTFFSGTTPLFDLPL